MPLKIRCPHCRRVLIAEDDVAGQTKACPACGRVLNVPLPTIPEPAEPQAPPRLACPHCGIEVAPAAAVCHQCYTDLITGRRLPLRQRWRRYSWRRWGAVGITAGLLIGGVLLGLHFRRLRTVSPELVYRPPPPVAVPAAELAAELLGARDETGRRAAIARLEPHGAAIADALAEALVESLRAVPDAARTGSQLAAIDLLGRCGATADGAGVRAALSACESQPALRAAALRARGLIGDAAALEALAAVWVGEVRRAAFLARLERVSPSGDKDARRVASDIVRRAQARAGDGLRALAVDSAPAVFSAVLAPYWESWSWLGHTRGDALADAVFELARPAEGSLDFRADDVRRPRDVLRRVGQLAAPETRAAAGLALLRRGPQYQSVYAEISAALGAALAGAPPATQQRLTWSIAVLRGKLFGNVARDHPLDVSASEVAEALAWAGVDSPAGSGGVAYPEMPILTWRARTGRAEAERALLAEFARGWPAVPAALDRWRAAGLGSSPAVHALLDPGQRTPQYPAVAAALVIAAEAGDRAVRPQLELWVEAVDQPAWLRAMAYTVLGSLDARAGAWDSGWPAGLTLDPAALESGAPGWDLFGRIIAAGGPAAVRRLEETKSASLSTEVRSRLVQAARRAAERTGP